MPKGIHIYEAGRKSWGGGKNVLTERERNSHFQSIQKKSGINVEGFYERIVAPMAKVIDMQLLLPVRCGSLQLKFRLAYFLFCPEYVFLPQLLQRQCNHEGEIKQVKRVSETDGKRMVKLRFKGYFMDT